jgi:ATP-binding cassette subfamily C protein
MIQWITQGLGSIKETKVAGREDFFLRWFSEASRRFARASLVFSIMSALPRLVIEVVAVGGMLLVVTVILLRGDELSTAIPRLALFAMAAVRIIPSLTRLFSALSSIRFYGPAVPPLHRDLAQAWEDETRLREATLTVRKEQPLLLDALEFREVGFTYEGASAPALAGISLRIARGSSVGFVGPSGSGKSTLIDLLLGLLAPQSGRIVIDGVGLQGVVADWQRSIGYVPQSIYLLDDTIRRNVALGIADEQIDDHAVRRALRQAQLESLVERLPAGTGTVIGENGVRLSGGERQRLGIARALYHGPQVLVLDEATSALDHHTENEITRTIRALVGERTVIVVAHRLSTVQMCDTIFVLTNGRIADAGTFEQLLAHSAEFRTLTGRDWNDPA